MKRKLITNKQVAKEVCESYLSRWESSENPMTKEQFAELNQLEDVLVNSIFESSPNAGFALRVACKLMLKSL